MAILIQNVELDGSQTDVLIEGNRFKTIAPNQEAGAAQVLDGKGMAILPTLSTCIPMRR